MASRPTNPYAGEQCKKIDLTIEQFYRATTCPPTVKIVNIKNGLIYELSQVRKCRRTPWIAFYDAIRAICDSSFTTPFTTFKVMVGRLESKRSVLIRNKKRDKLDVLFQEPFAEYIQIMFPPKSKPKLKNYLPNYRLSVYEMLISELKGEI